LNKLMKFWLDKGVDGLRLDVISAISKRIDFPDTDTPDFNETIRKYYANGPRLKDFIKEAKEKVWDHYDVMTVGEGPGITPQNAKDYLDDQHGLNMIFHFGHMFMDQGEGGRFDPVQWKMKDFKQVFKTWDDAFKEKGWGSVFLGNHDFARMVSRWGNDRDYWEKSSKLLCTLLLTMRGTTFIFQGDEIGMTNTRLNSVNESKDIETLNGWREAQKKGILEKAFLQAANYAGRDNARTPMQWNSDLSGGFSNGESWMHMNKNTFHINVEAQQVTGDSILNYFRKMTAFRKANPVLTYGRYQPLEETPDSLFLYFRESDKEKLLIVLNFSDQVTNLPDLVRPMITERLIGNYPGPGNADEVRAWEAIVYRCET
jgi:oligo-1,6-glucosidase